MAEETSLRLSKEERRQQIIEAALQVFIQKGYRAATTVEIAKAADISEVTLFRYFASKQEIFQAGIEPILVESLESDLLIENQELSIEGLSLILQHRIRFLSDHKDVVKLILNEKVLQQNDVTYVQKMVSALQDYLKKRHYHISEELTLRLLLGSFLSFLYLPEQSDQQITDYANFLAHTILSL